MPDCKDKKVGHNFVAGVCTKCSVNQYDLSYPLKEKKIKYEPEPSKNIHSSLHLLVKDIRKEFGETAKKGKGSFSFYLGFFKRIGEQRVREIWSQTKLAKAGKRYFWSIIGKTKV
jgi:hypothetical protein